MDSDQIDNARAEQARKGSPFLTTEQAAHYVGLSRRTLEKMRTIGGGPLYRKHGRYVRYHIADLDAWSTAHRQHSTSEADARALAMRHQPRRNEPRSAPDDRNPMRTHEGGGRTDA
jgi:excisionase family DNA binding protein